MTVSIGSVVAEVFAPAGHELASMGADRIVRVWDADSGRMLGELYRHENPGKGLAYSPDGARLVSGGGGVGQDIVLWNLAERSQMATNGTDGYYASDAVWSPDGAHYVVVSRGSSRIYIYNADGTLARQSRVGGIPLVSVAHTARYMAVASEFGATYIYDYTPQGAYLFRREMRYDHDVPALDTEFSPDGSLLATCYLDGVINIWQTDGWELARSFKAHEYVEDRVDGCLDGAFSRRGDVYFSVGGDGQVLGWDPYTGERLFGVTYSVPVRVVSVSADGELVAVGLQDGTVRIFAPDEPASPARR